MPILKADIDGIDIKNNWPMLIPIPRF